MSQRTLNRGCARERRLALDPLQVREHEDRADVKAREVELCLRGKVSVQPRLAVQRELRRLHAAGDAVNEIAIYSMGCGLQRAHGLSVNREAGERCLSFQNRFV